MIVVVKLVYSLSIIGEDLITTVRGDNLRALNLQKEALLRLKLSLEKHFRNTDSLQNFNYINFLIVATNTILISFLFLVRRRTFLKLSSAFTTDESSYRTKNRFNDFTDDFLVANVRSVSRAVLEHVMDNMISVILVHIVSFKIFL